MNQSNHHNRHHYHHYQIINCNHHQRSMLELKFLTYKQLIDNQPNSEQLTAELKSLLLKYYWSGFDLGYETDKR